MHRNNNPASAGTAVKPQVMLFPYQAKASPRSAQEYRAVARLQQAEEIHRRTEFSKRLDELKQSGQDIRSFPTPALGFEQSEAPVYDNSVSTRMADYDIPPVGAMTRPPQQQADVNAPAAVQPMPASDDSYPFDAPPIDPSQYGGVEVDDEYDTTVPAAPMGEEGQPDTYDWSKATVGEVTTFGSFPYRYQKGASKTFMVRLGTQDLWGVDLKRVAREFNLKKGDRVALMCIGKQPVEVPVRKRQEDGSYQIVHETKMRNTWVAKRVR
ncbi:hypothetical protein L4Z68_002330 [Pseudomonas aeruginosa]|nr:hypothetical protein [Pseudomonas aeruginosa]EKX2970314.1 hypothetical protein [Pseudomonas aeruginosa]HBO6962550.1 hypothetical protein [Pseudomonas aeruginosa]HBO7218215.1 hypothetical protein [Pseudomonas aeruginosa]HDV6122827.1 hypothetical protein [Pseudomonas aeruginosa]